MNSRFILKNESGFTLVQAIFILVVLSLLGVAMMRLANVQNTTSVFSLQGARAYHAARSGLEWGAARASAGNSCSGTMTLDGFTVTVSCLPPQSFTEGVIGPYNVYQLSSLATFGNYGSADYISRRAEAKVGFP